MDLSKVTATESEIFLQGPLGGGGTGGGDDFGRREKEIGSLLAGSGTGGGGGDKSCGGGGGDLTWRRLGRRGGRARPVERLRGAVGTEMGRGSGGMARRARGPVGGALPDITTLIFFLLHPHGSPLLPTPLQTNTDNHLTTLYCSWPIGLPFHAFH